MSIFTTIETVLEALTLADYWANYTPEGRQVPAVVGIRDSYEPLMKLDGAEGTAKSVFTFHCLGRPTDKITAKASALAIAQEVKALIDASALVKTRFRLPVGSEEFAEETLQFMEPVRYSFWHPDT